MHASCQSFSKKYKVHGGRQCIHELTAIKSQRTDNRKERLTLLTVQNSNYMEKLQQFSKAWKLRLRG